ncbi:hypothetical protein [Wolbachia endosymbiont (group E) of Neria commutata]|uniref:hypothetical protein n=1 Tax=Wolbachia endosymbiont (group E) of Neria commutata TaxID=3066149 RepID=UPI0031329E07
MRLYNRGTIDIGSAVDYLLDMGYGNHFFPEDLQDISLKDFRLVFLGENSERLIRMIMQNHYKDLFNAASRLRILEECLSMEVEKDEFQGNLSDYLQYRVDRNDDFSEKYIDVLDIIQGIQKAELEVPAQSRQPVDQSNEACMEEGLNLDITSFFRRWAGTSSRRRKCVKL